MIRYADLIKLILANAMYAFKRDSSKNTESKESLLLSGRFFLSCRVLRSYLEAPPGFCLQSKHQCFIL